MRILSLALGFWAITAAIAQPAKAAIMKYTYRAAFEMTLQPGFYLEIQMYSKFPAYSGNGYSYTASATGGEYDIGPDLSTYSGTPSTIVFNFGPQIKAFGGYFYNTDLPGNFTGGPFVIQLNNGASIYDEISTSTNTFYGFISDADLMNAQISVDAVNFATAGSVIVGTPVSGPLPVVGAASAFAFSRRLRHRLARARHGG